MSIVSVSRRAAPPHFGHVTFTNSGTSSSGERPLPVNSHVQRQHHRQIALRHRHHAALRAVDHRDRRAPVALPRDAPVLDAKRDRALCRSLPPRPWRSCARRASALGRPDHSPEFSTMPSSVNAAFMSCIRASAPSTGRITGRIGMPYLRAELEIALIVRRHGHDRAGAVAHQHEVADPDRHLLAAVRIDGVVAGEEAFLLDVARTLVARARRSSPWRAPGPPRRAAARPADAPAPGSRRSRRRSYRRAW